MKEENEFYLNEAESHISKGEKDILKFEKEPTNKEIISDLKYVFEALSGLSGAIGLNNASIFCKDIEEFLESSKNMKKLSEKPESFVNLILKIFEVLRSINNHDKEGILNDLKKENIQEIKSLIEDFKSEFEITFINPLPFHKIKLVTKDKDNLFYKIHIYISPSCKFKKVRLFFIFRALNNIGRLCWSNPDPDKLEKGDFDFDFEIYLISKSQKEEILEILDEILEVEKKFIDVLNTKKFEGIIKNINIDKQREYLEKASEELIKETGINEDIKFPVELKLDLKKVKFIFIYDDLSKEGKNIFVPQIHFINLLNHLNIDLIFYASKSQNKQDFVLYIIKEGFKIINRDNDFEYFEKIFKIREKGFLSFEEFLESVKYGVENAEIFKDFKKSKYYNSNINSYMKFIRNG